MTTTEVGPLSALHARLYGEWIRRRFPDVSGVGAMYDDGKGLIVTVPDVGGAHMQASLFCAGIAALEEWARVTLPPDAMLAFCDAERALEDSLEQRRTA